MVLWESPETYGVRGTAQVVIVCKIPLLARALGPKAYAAARPSARATIGYLVYKSCEKYGVRWYCERALRRMVLEVQGVQHNFELKGSNFRGRVIGTLQLHKRAV